MRARLLRYIDEALRRTILAWVQLRYRSSFDGLNGFCLFVGYPRSGHSLVGAMLNAHPDVVVAHEAKVPELMDDGCSRDALCAKLIVHAIGFNRQHNMGNYPFDIPGQWQGRIRSLKVVGDKRGGLVTRRMAEDPGFLKEVRTLMRCPLRLVHVVRNPFDNIAAISIHHDMTVSESLDYYFKHCETTRNLEKWCDPSELITIHHEDMVADPGRELSRLIEFLGVVPSDGYLEACADIVFDKPALTRAKVEWSQSAIDSVAERISKIPFLTRYCFNELEFS